MPQSLLVQATGRRKRSTARVIFREGNGDIKVNGRSIDEYFSSVLQKVEATKPLKATGKIGFYDITANISGGGLSGQAGALKLGIARGLVELDPELRATLKIDRMLTRDSRKKESKKYGLKKARKASQFSKR